jgi:hypothetical protein
MPTRTPHTGVAGEVLTAANLAKYPKGWLGYAEVTSSQTGIGTTPTDITGATLTVTVPADRLIKIEARTQIYSSSAVYGAIIFIEDGATIGRAGRVLLEAGEAKTISGFSVRTPAAGSHTYKLQGESSASTITNSADGTYPLILVVQDIGPAS